MKIDILKNELYITSFRRVLKNYVPQRKIIHTAGRKCDAMLFVLSGNCEYRFNDGTKFTVKAGDVFYLAKDSIYEMDVSEERYEVIFVDFLFDSPEERQSTRFSLQGEGEYERHFQRLLHTYVKKDAGYASRCLSELYRIYAKLIEISNATYLPSPSQQKAEKARDHILQNLTQNDLRLCEIAKIAEVSEVYLRKLFHTCYGVSPNQYITNARLRYAKELMQEPDLTLEDIALQSGFASLSYFCRVFKDAEGIPAGAFRKELLKVESSKRAKTRL